MLKVRDLMISFSLANIIFIQRWASLIYTDHYYLKYNPTQGIIAVMVCVLLSGTIIFLSSAILIKLQFTYLNDIRKVILIATMIYPLNFLRNTYALGVSDFYQLVVGHLGFSAAKIAIALFGMFIFILIFVFRDFLSSGVRIIALISAPFVVVTILKSIWMISNLNPALFSEKSPIKADKTISGGNKGRVVWIIFDELDQQFLFDKRPNDLQLPEIDQLKARSFYASNAFPPAGSTLLSIPSLITGKLVRNAQPAGANELSIEFSDVSSTVKFSEQKNVFSDVQAMGYKTASVGWYHSLGRVLKKDLDQSSWYAYRYYSGNPDIGLVNEIINQFCDVLNLSGYTSLFTESISMQYHLTMLTTLLSESMQVVGNPNLDLVMLHLPVPHIPYLYDMKSKHFVKSHIVSDGYFNNLALVDKTIKDIRTTLHQNGLEERTAIIISSDHWWRAKNMMSGTKDYRVPFILFLLNSYSETHYDKPFNTVLTRQIITELLAGKIVDYESLVHWLNDRRTIGKSPLY